MNRNKLEKISIVTPSFNQAAFIEKTILSVVNQEYPDIEHIIIDGRSTDGTIEILKRHKHLKWISERDRGQTDAINKGVKMTTSNVIGWLNSDDTYEPGSIQSVMEEFNKDPLLDVVYGNCNYIDENDKTMYVYTTPSYNLNKLISCGYNYISQPACFYRKRIFDKIGLFNTSLNYSMDHDLFIRMGLHDLKIIKINKILANFRKHSCSKSVSNILKMRKESFDLGKKYSKGMGAVLVYINWILAFIILSSPLGKLVRKKSKS